MIPYLTRPTHRVYTTHRYANHMIWYVLRSAIICLSTLGTHRAKYQQKFHARIFLLSQFEMNSFEMFYDLIFVFLSHRIWITSDTIELNWIASSRSETTIKFVRTSLQLHSISFRKWIQSVKAAIDFVTNFQRTKLESIRPSFIYFY